MNFFLPRFPWSKNTWRHPCLLFDFHMYQSPGEHGEEGWTRGQFALWDYRISFVLQCCSGPSTCAWVVLFTMHRGVEFDMQQGVSAILLKSWGLYSSQSAPIHPVRKKAFILLLACRRVGDNTPECEMREEMSLGHCLAWPSKLRCVQMLWEVWVCFRLKKAKPHRWAALTWEGGCSGLHGSCQEPANNSSSPGEYLLVWIIVFLWPQTCYLIQHCFSWFFFRNMVHK